MITFNDYGEFITNTQRVALSGCCAKLDNNVENLCFEVFGEYFTVDDLSFEDAVTLIRTLNERIKENEIARIDRKNDSI